MKRLIKCGAAAAALVLGMAAPAAALEGGDDVAPETGEVTPQHSDTGSTSLPNGHTLTGNVWIQNFAGWDGCGDYATSAVATVTTNWIQNVTSATAHGIGATISGLSGGAGNKTQSTTWRNTNAAGSYLSGTVCANWLTLYVSMDISASTFYYGNVRTVSAGV